MASVKWLKAVVVVCSCTGSSISVTDSSCGGDKWCELFLLVERGSA